MQYPLRLRAEWICNYYCLTVATVADADIPDDFNRQLYTVKTYREVRNQVPESEVATALEVRIDKAIDLYLNYKPTAAELSEQLAEFCYRETDKKWVSSPDWFPKFLYKAALCVSSCIGLGKGDVRCLTNRMVFIASITTQLEFLQRIKPALRNLF